MEQVKATQFDDELQSLERQTTRVQNNSEQLQSQMMEAWKDEEEEVHGLRQQANDSWAPDVLGLAVLGGALLLSP